MDLGPTPDDRAALEAAARAERRARARRRYRAVLLLGDGRPPPAVARALGCSASSVYGWAAAWRRPGGPGRAGRAAAGGAAGRGPAGAGARGDRVDGAAAARGAGGGRRAGRRPHRAAGAAPARLGLEAAQVRARPARPRRRAKTGGVAERAAATLAAGGEVWAGDETALREFPPLRAAWARRGEQAAVEIGGRNARRAIFGALNAATGEPARVARQRGRADDALAFVEALGAVRPGVPKLLVRDNAPPHHPTRVKAAARAAGIEVAFLPFRSPEPMPLEDLWRGLKQAVAANRCYPSIDALAERALAWLDGLANEERLRRCGLRSSKFDWLPT